MASSRSEEIMASQQAEKELRRLFILGTKEVTEDEIRSIFSQFGTLTEVKKTYDKQGIDRGISYVSYAKTSEAFLAVEEGDGYIPPSHPERSLRVNISKNAKEAPKATETMLNKVFLRVKPEINENNLKTEFSTYGKVARVRIVRNKETQESRGLAFVTFERNYSAAKALEECNPEYQANFAENKSKGDMGNMTSPPGAMAYGPDGPRQPMSRYGRELPDMGRGGLRGRGGYRGGRAGMEGGRYDAPQHAYDPYDPLQPPPIPRNPYEDFDNISMGPNPSRAVQSMIERDPVNAAKRTSCTVNVKGCSNISERQLFRLFDIVPGIKLCKLDSIAGTAVVKYESPECAAHACEKLNNLEYPPGIIECALQPVMASGVANAAEQLKESVKSIMSGNADIQSLVGTLQAATEALQHAGLSQDMGLERVPWCTAPLPPKQPLSTAPMAEKLFIHIFVEKMPGQRYAFPPSFQAMLNDAFCRFGNLINVSVLATKSCAFAQFATKESADRAMKTLSGEVVGGYARLKVMFADNFKDRDSKREGESMDTGYDIKRARNDHEYH